eukprot:5209192-Pleurochrysis_carterae.AAC.1
MPFSSFVMPMRVRASSEFRLAYTSCSCLFSSMQDCQTRVQETPVQCTATVVAAATSHRCASAQCVLRGFVSETEWIDETTYKANCGGSFTSGERT